MTVPNPRYTIVGLGASDWIRTEVSRFIIGGYESNSEQEGVKFKVTKMGKSQEGTAK